MENSWSSLGKNDNCMINILWCLTGQLTKVHFVVLQTSMSIDSFSFICDNCLFNFRLDSYVFAETFKYLYLLFADKSDLVINIDDYLFTTEAHLLPLTLSVYNSTTKVPKVGFMQNYY